MSVAETSIFVVTAALSVKSDIVSKPSRAPPRTSKATACQSGVPEFPVIV